MVNCELRPLHSICLDCNYLSSGTCWAWRDNKSCTREGYVRRRGITVVWCLMSHKSCWQCTVSFVHLLSSPDLLRYGFSDDRFVYTLVVEDTSSGEWGHVDLAVQQHSRTYTLQWMLPACSALPHLMWWWHLSYELHADGWLPITLLISHLVHWMHCLSFYVCIHVWAGASSDSPPVVGYAVYYFTYSTWEGRVLHMEDLFVQDQYRGKEVVHVL